MKGCSYMGLSSGLGGGGGATCCGGGEMMRRCLLHPPAEAPLLLLSLQLQPVAAPPGVLQRRPQRLGGLGAGDVLQDQPEECRRRRRRRRS